MTLSFHQSGVGGFFPGTGHANDCGAKAGKNYSLNFPLQAGMDDESYASIFKPVVTKVMESFQPGAVVLCCGADSIAGDPRKEKLSSTDKFRSAMDSIEAGVSLFVWMEPSEARPWLDKVAEDYAVARFRDSMDQKYAAERPGIESRLKQQLFNTDGRLSADQQRQLDNAVDQALEELDADERARQVPAFREEFQQGLLPLQWLDWASLMLKANRRKASIVVDGALRLD